LTPAAAAAKPQVSIVLPTYNRAILLERAARSVLAQAVPLELLVVDDGSTDPAMPAVLARLAKDRRVRVLAHPTNLGAGAARNTGSNAARAPYIAFHDSDDEWLPGKLRLQIDALERSPQAGLCYTDQTRVEPDGATSPFPAPDVETGRLVDPRTHDWAVRGIGIQTCVFRAPALLGAGPGPFDASLRRFIDLELLLRVCRDHPVIHLPVPTVLHHEGTDGISSNPAAQADSRRILLQRYGRADGADRAFRAFQHERIAANLALAGRRREAAGEAWRAAALQPRRLPWAMRMTGAAVRNRPALQPDST
jgi:glycosyltransferase involved in cell wall biosynthesis